MPRIDASAADAFGARNTFQARHAGSIPVTRSAGLCRSSGLLALLEEWMNLWLETIASRKVRPSTLTGYRTCLKRINLVLGHHRLDKLQPEHLEAFYTRLEADGLSSTTALLHHRVISRALKVALQRGRVARNVATLVDAPRHGARRRSR
jgi:integrase